jgi:hypothetical protein
MTIRFPHQTATRSVTVKGKHYTFPDEKSVPMAQLDIDKLEPDLLDELRTCAGVDRYTAPVAIGELAEDWSPGPDGPKFPKGTKVLRHGNSSGMNYFVCEDEKVAAPAQNETGKKPDPGAAPTPPGGTPAAGGGAK